MANELILAVDDEAHILELLTFNLEASGYRVVTAANGEDALYQRTYRAYSAKYALPEPAQAASERR